MTADVLLAGLGGPLLGLLGPALLAGYALGALAAAWAEAMRA
jgi:hypothetical protein